MRWERGVTVFLVASLVGVLLWRSLERGRIYSDHAVAVLNTFTAQKLIRYYVRAGGQRPATLREVRALVARMALKGGVVQRGITFEFPSEPGVVPRILDDVGWDANHLEFDFCAADIRLHEEMLTGKLGMLDQELDRVYDEMLGVANKSLSRE